MICDLCGRTFGEEEGRASCRSCGSEAQCKGVHCPYCYYEMLPRPAWIEKLVAIFRQNKGNSKSDHSGQGALSLKNLEVRRRAWVSRFQTRDLESLRKILAMGILPGVELILIQKFPSHVFQIGESQFSVDENLASAIHVSLAPS